MNSYIKLLLIQAPVILFALTVHEFCHAWVANMLGDDTAKRQGRLTLNPIAHLDVLGTILMFVVGFGWARPVPINPLNFKNPRKGMLLVALAGPVSNLIMARQTPGRFSSSTAWLIGRGEAWASNRRSLIASIAQASHLLGNGQVHVLGDADGCGNIARDVRLDEDVMRWRLDQEDRGRVVHQKLFRPTIEGEPRR